MRRIIPLLTTKKPATTNMDFPEDLNCGLQEILTECRGLRCEDLVKHAREDIADDVVLEIFILAVFLPKESLEEEAKEAAQALVMCFLNFE